jgi:hypothetical protein
LTLLGLLLPLLAGAVDLEEQPATHRCCGGRTVLL